MRKTSFALAPLLFLNVLSAATRIDDPKAFITEVYRRYSAVKSSDYFPPDDIYTPRLAKLLRDDRRKAKGEVGCLEFNYWVDGQDFTITRVAITGADEAPDRKTIIAKFANFDKPREIHYDFQRVGGRWLLDDVHSTLDPTWTLSALLKCPL
jgi:hypothetical protein